MQSALEILDKYWKYKSFRPYQDTVISSVISGQDTLAILPTGGGKSLCFQVPTMLSDGICLVISPLIALMKDQVNQLQSRNIKAIALAGSLKPSEISILLDNCQFGGYKFLYLSPERLEQEWILERLKTLPITLIAIDEAHCVSQWGHDFRPAYLKIKNLKTIFDKTPFVALTATATPEVKEDIIAMLGLEKPNIIQQSFERKNIAYFIINAEDKEYKINQILKKNPQPSIIYVRDRKGCLEYAQKLKSLGHTATYYHGGLSSKERELNMNSWIKDKNQVMVATSAFGMGIDKPNVKTVIHINLPENLESYYQEAGRAGRNGEKAFAIFINSVSDSKRVKNQFLDVLPTTDFLKLVYLKLCTFFQIPYGDGINQEFNFNLNQFCSHYQFPVIKVYNSLRFLDQQGIITLSQEFSEKVSVQFLIPSKEVIRYCSLNKQHEPIIATILRTYPGIFELQTNINTTFISQKSAVTEESVLKLLEILKQQGIINLNKQINESKITFLTVRQDEKTINWVSKYLEKQNEIKKNKLEAVISFVSNNNTCKNKVLLQYFGESKEENCNICSYCLSINKTNVLQDISALILKTLDNNPLTSRELVEVLNKPENEVLKNLHFLLENNLVSLNFKNQFISITQ